ncbi:serine/arginine-rich SC35-like splicing factor SCL28 isoform X2 [Tripterygium wilfordii]|uniref:serine/arginine-rich SC35-like splicing factor SCL28 isoform X2 n=1 Tax=Tripterygium wilfordii TaxID=458696 RepID=UPI0018F848A6|nr:serine/arginine-rich SC35-like splicing factor SCL28 isoform X2 [Tripterygium wilfordii]
MGRYRSRSRSLSYSPRRRSRTPPRGRKRYEDDYYPSHRDRRSPAPSGLLIRNLPLDARPEDLRIPFEKYGPVKDVYLPKNYYTGEPRGFGFVKYRYGEDAAVAKEHMNHRVIGGREIRIVFAEENRKNPQEMRMSSRGSRQGGSQRRRTPLRSPRRRHHSYSRSLSPTRRDSRGHGARDDDYSLGRSRTIPSSRSPRDDENRSRKRSLSPRENGHSPHDERNYSPHQSGSPRGGSRSPSGPRSRSYSPR